MSAFESQNIFELMLPGSHDAGTYSYPLRTFVIASDWFQTQDFSFYEQLMHGVRYIDVRVAEMDGEFVLIHMFKCVNMREALLDVRRFLQEHPTEVVVLRPSDRNKMSG